MKKYICLFIYLLCGCSALYCQTVDTILTINGDGRDEPNKLCSDAAGNIYIAGAYMGAKVCMSDTCLQRTGETSTFLYKISPSGEVLWGRRTERGGWSSGLTLDNRGMVWFLTGTHQGAYLTKYSSAGTLLTTISLAMSHASYFHEVIADGNGYFYIAGYEVNKSSPSQNQNWVLAKYDSLGQQIWAIKDPTAPYMTRVQDLVFEENGDILFCGFEENLNNKGQAGFIAKCSISGKLVWKKQISDGYCTVTAIETDSKNNVLVSGRFSDSVRFHPKGELVESQAHEDFLVAKYSDKGEYLWHRTGGGDQSEVAFSIAADAHDQIYVVGVFLLKAKIDSFEIIGKGSFDCFLAQFDAKGNILRVETLLDGNDMELAMNVMVTPTQNLVISGYYGNYSTNQIPQPSYYKEKALPLARMSNGFLMMQSITLPELEGEADAPD